MFQRIKAASIPCLLPHHQSAPESLPILGPREKNNRFFLCPFLEQPSNQQTFHFLLYWKGTFKSISSWVSASDPPKHFRPHVPLIFLSFGKHILIYCHHSDSILTSHIQSYEDHKPPFWKAGTTGNIFFIKPAGSQKAWLQRPQPLCPYLKPKSLKYFSCRILAFLRLWELFPQRVLAWTFVPKSEAFYHKSAKDILLQWRMCDMDVNSSWRKPCIAPRWFLGDILLLRVCSVSFSEKDRKSWLISFLSNYFFKVTDGAWCQSRTR